MSGPLRRPTIPQCTACLRNYAFGAFDTAAPVTAVPVRTQVRGKKKMVNLSATVPVKLLKDVPSFGRRGHILPIPRGQMRNHFYPTGLASYITVPELRTLRLSNTIMERDFAFGTAPVPASTSDPAVEPWQRDLPSDIKSMSTDEITNASAFLKAPVVEKLTPERSMELVEIFVPKRLDFYRQPIIEEKTVEETVPEPPKKPKFMMGGAAGDLMAARQRTPAPEKAKKREAGQAIYGSVSVQDVLVAMRAALETNDEAARVALQEGDVEFVDLPAVEEAGKVKHVGEFSVDVRVKGAETGVRRNVRVLAQEM